MYATLQIAALFLCFAADVDRHFAGTWILNADRSDTRALSAAPDRMVRIQHNDSTIKLIPITEGVSSPLLHVTTDQKSTKLKMGAVTLNSMAKWEGAALLINTIVSRPDGNHTQMDRWRLSRDGQTLTIRRQIVDRGGEREATLVYDRE